MANSLIPLDTLAGTIKAHIAAGDKAFGKAEEHYKSAGLHLIEARDRVKREGVTFSAFIVSHCNINSSRAYELIAIADGRTSVKELRKKKRESVRRTRAASPLRSGQSEEDQIVARQILATNGEHDETAREQLAAARAEINQLTEENNALKDRVEVSALELACLRAENERLRSERDDDDKADLTISPFLHMIDGLKEENSDLRELVGDLMEDVESMYEDATPSRQEHWEKFDPRIDAIGTDYRNRLDKAYPMDDDGFCLDTDYVEPERGELVDTLLDDHRQGRFIRDLREPTTTDQREAA